MIDYVLLNTEKIYNTSNEVLNRYVLNRNFKKLIENDIQLNKLYEEVISNGNNIQLYVDGMSYDKGQLIWFCDTNLHGKKSLYLLESLYDNNTNVPELRHVENNEYSFQASGWNDKNEYTTIIENNVSAYIVQDFLSKLNTLHEFDKDYHKFGKLTSEKEYNDTKMLLNDMSNIDIDRQNNFFPYCIKNLSSDNAIMSGTYRKWDNGLLEYDIIFKLSYVSQYYEHGAEYELLSCNTFSIDDNDKDLNSKYFLDDLARQIFLNKEESPKQSKIENTIQVNRNNYINSYSAILNFPESFCDLNYMIFQSDVRCQEKDTRKQSIDAGSNTMTYANKKKNQITALYLMFPKKDVYDATKNGLVSNSFHCHVIGRWK